MPANANVGLKAMLKPQVDEGEAKREVAKLEDLIEDAEQMDMDLDTSDAEDALERLQGRMSDSGGGGGGDGGMGDELAQNVGEKVSDALGGGKAGGLAGSAAGKAASKVGGMVGGAGGAAGGAGAAGALSAAASVAAPVALAGAVGYGMLKGVQKMASFAPAGKKMTDMFGTAMELAFRPLGRLVGQVLMPYAEGALKAMAALNRYMEEDGLVVGGMKFLADKLPELPGALADATGEAFGEWFEGTGLDNLDELSWEDYVDIIKWTSFISPLSWGGYIAGLLWKDFIVGIVWDDWLSNLNWSSWIETVLEWARWVEGVFDWSDWVKGKLKWADWLNPLNWTDWLGGKDDFDWGDWLGGFEDWLNNLSLPDWLSGPGKEEEEEKSPRDPKKKCGKGSHWDPMMQACVPNTSSSDEGDDSGDGGGGGGGSGGSGDKSPVQGGPGDCPPGHYWDPLKRSCQRYEDIEEARNDDSDGGGLPGTGRGGLGGFSGLASGGVVTKATRILAGERGKEAIIPLEDYDLGLEEERMDTEPQQVDATVDQPLQRVEQQRQEVRDREDMDEVKERLEDVVRAINDLNLDVSLEVDGETLAETNRQARDQFIDERDVVR